MDQVVVMTLLSEEPGLTQQAIIERSCSDPSTVRAMLVLLERRGWVRRESNPHDKRVRRVSLTAEGRRQQRRLQGVSPIGADENMEQLLSKEELRVVAECLKRIVSRQSVLADRELDRSTR